MKRVSKRNDSTGIVRSGGSGSMVTALKKQPLRLRPAGSGFAVGKLRPLLRGDDMLVISVLALTALGLVMVYSASLFVAVKHNQSDWYYFLRQLRLLAPGLLALLAGMFLKVDYYRRFCGVLFAGICILMVLQLVTPLGAVINNTRRWINLGFFNLQTSDLARCILIMVVASVVAAEPNIVKTPNKRLGLLLVAIAIPTLLTNFQPDLTGSLIVALAGGLTLFFGGLSLLNIVLLALCILPGLMFLALTRPYQIARVTSFIASRFSGSDVEYQTFQSLVGFGRGGVLGVGLGLSKQKMLFLPEPHTDFIYSIIGEELGLIGTALVLVTFMVLMWRMVLACNRQEDRFRFLLGSGVASSMIVFALINMGVAVGILPVTGLPLPFISSGGTSLVLSLWSAGLLWNLSRSADSGFPGSSNSAKSAGDSRRTFNRNVVVR